jgi:hypothetical protein
MFGSCHRLASKNIAKINRRWTQMNADKKATSKKQQARTSDEFHSALSKNSEQRKAMNPFQHETTAGPVLFRTARPSCISSAFIRVHLR